MDNFDKELNNLDLKLEGILSKIGDAVRGFGIGIKGDRYSNSDAENAFEKGDIGKVEKEYIATSGTDELKKVASGKPDLYLIGKNEAFNVEDDLYPFLQFEIDNLETKKRGKLVYYSDREKVIKNRPELDWIFKGSFLVKSLGLSKTKIKGSGGINGKLLTFTDAVWESGSFKGIMKGNKSEIIGGQIVDGYYIANSKGFKIDPWDFKSGGYSAGEEFVMGMRRVKDNTKYSHISLIQVPSGKVIKIIDNGDEEHLIRVQKGIDYKSLDFQINDETVMWNNYNGSENDFKKSFINVGKTFSIPGVISIEKGVQSIEIKTSEYESLGKDTTHPPENKEPEQVVNKSANKFDIKTKQPGWSPNKKIGYYLLDIDTNDAELVALIEKNKNDINSGKFFRYINYFKKLIEEGRIDGYGNFPDLAFLFPQKIGVLYKNADTDRESTMKYFSDFRKNVINNFKSQNVSDYYLRLLKKNILQDATTKTKPKTVKTINKGVRDTGSLSESFNLSLSEILKNQLNKNS